MSCLAEEVKQYVWRGDATREGEGCPEDEREAGCRLVEVVLFGGGNADILQPTQRRPQRLRAKARSR